MQNLALHISRKKKEGTSRQFGLHGGGGEWAAKQCTNSTRLSSFPCVVQPNGNGRWLRMSDTKLNYAGKMGYSSAQPCSGDVLIGCGWLMYSHSKGRPH